MAAGSARRRINCDCCNIISVAPRNPSASWTCTACINTKRAAAYQPPQAPAQLFSPRAVSSQQIDQTRAILDTSTQLTMNQPEAAAQNNVSDSAALVTMEALVTQAFDAGFRPKAVRNKYGIQVQLSEADSRRFLQPPAGPGDVSVYKVYDRDGDVPIPDPAHLPMSEACANLGVMGKSQLRKICRSLQNMQTGRVELDSSHLQGAGKADRKEQLDSVSTQRELYVLCNDRIRTAVAENRTAKSQLVHVSAVCQWVLFCTNLGVSPFRWEWYLRGDLSASQLAKEDGLFALYVSFLSLKTSDKQSIENYLSAARTFHMDKLHLTPPPMPLTSRLVDLFGKKQLSENPVRRRRDIMTPDEYRAVCSWWDDLAATSESAGDEQAAFLFRTLAALVSCTFHGGLRTGHLAPGKFFSVAKHWSLRTLKIFSSMSLEDDLRDRVACITSPHSKTLSSSKAANERAQEAFPYELFDDEANFPLNAQKLLNCLPTTVQGVNVTAIWRSDWSTIPAFSKFEKDGTGRLRIVALSEKEVSDFTKLAVAASIPGGENITVGIHCGRKSSNAALQSAGVPEDRRCAIHGRTGGDTGVTTGEYDEKCFVQTVEDIRSAYLAKVSVASRGGLTADALSTARQNPRTLAQLETQPSAPPAPAVGSKEAEDLQKSLELSQPASKATDFAHLSSAFAESLEDHVVRERAHLTAAVSESRQSYDAAIANSLNESLEQNGRPRKLFKETHAYLGQPASMSSGDRVLVPDSDEEDRESVVMPTDDEDDGAENSSGDESVELPDTSTADRFLSTIPLPLSGGRNQVTQALATVGAATAAAAAASPAKTRASSLSLPSSRADLRAALADLVLVESFASAPGVATLVTDLPAQDQLLLQQTLKQQGLCIAPSNVDGAGAGLFTSATRNPMLDKMPPVRYTGHKFNAPDWGAHQLTLTEAAAAGLRIWAPAFDSVAASLSPYAMHLGSGVHVCAETTFTNILRYIQHSSNPNVINCMLVQLIYPAELAQDSDILPVLMQIPDSLPANTELFMDYNAGIKCAPAPEPELSPQPAAAASRSPNPIFASFVRRGAALASAKRAAEGLDIGNIVHKRRRPS
eukprot:COSAG01_NODE_730_length_14022_cov_127.417511_2_plen_1094_part_00